MNQDGTVWLRKITFLSMVILVVIASVVRVRLASAQATPAEFDAVDDYINPK